MCKSAAKVNAQQRRAEVRGDASPSPQAAGLSQEALAERANLSADFLGFIERGENVPTLTTILQLARALGVQPSKIIKDFDG